MRVSRSLVCLGGVLVRFEFGGVEKSGLRERFFGAEGWGTILGI